MIAKLTRAALFGRHGISRQNDDGLGSAGAHRHYVFGERCGSQH
jgi:hypothetical protein